MLRRRLHVWICLGACLAAGATGPPAAGEQTTKPATRPRPIKVKVTFSKQTTYILGPVRKDGTPDYVAWVNARLSKGVTPQNNAAVLLVQAIGPEMLDKQTARAVLKRLGIKSLPAQGEYFVRLKDYVDKHAPPEKLKPAPPKLDQKVLEQLKAALSPQDFEKIRAGAPGPAEAQAEAEQQHAKATGKPWTTKGYPMIAGWLKANHKPLDLIAAATKRPRCYIPLIAPGDPPSMVSALLRHVGWVRDIARALAARAMLRLGAGDRDRAWADLLAVHRLARLVAQGATLGEHVVAIAIDGIACKAGAALAADPTLTAAGAKAALADLSALAALPDVAEKIDLGERLFGLAAVMDTARGALGEVDAMQKARGAPGKALGLQKRQLDWDLILRRFNTVYDRLAAAMRTKGFAARQKAVEELLRELEARVAGADRRPSLRRPASLVRLLLAATGLKSIRLRLTEAVADMLLAVLLPAVGRTCVFQDRQTMAFGLARLSFALAAWRKEKGAYPAKLAALAPGLMKTIPKDIFTDKPLIYKRQANGYLLYSLGENMKDDGGVKQGYEKDDIAVRAKR